MVAYSGGCDSQALLHALAGVREDTNLEIVAAHFDHGLQAQSAEWADQCKGWCAQLDVACITVRREVRSAAGDSVEANAREARYGWLQEICDADQVVLTAHHADDQAETFLLNLFWGKEIQQLAGIAPARPLVHGSATCLHRPLLRFRKKQLNAYARGHNLQWIEDPSNRNIGFYRNYIRHELMPVWERRWPDLVAALNKGADFSRIIARRDRMEMDALCTRFSSPRCRGVFCLVDPLRLDCIDGLDEFQVIGVIRCWIHRAGYAAPSKGQLLTLYQQIVERKSPAASLQLNGRMVRYFNRCLYLTRPVRRANLQSGAGLAAKTISWDLQPLKIPACGIAVELCRAQSGVDAKILQGKTIELSWRDGGERVQLNHRQHRSSLKKLFQTKRVPPWERDNLPYLKIDHEIAWAYGVGWLGDYAAAENPGAYPRFAPIND